MGHALLLYAGDYDAAIAQGAETFEIDESMVVDLCSLGPPTSPRATPNRPSAGSSVARASTRLCVRMMQ